MDKSWTSNLKSHFLFAPDAWLTLVVEPYLSK